MLFVCVYIYIFIYIHLLMSMHLLHYIKLYVFTHMSVPTHLLIFTLRKLMSRSRDRLTVVICCIYGIIPTIEIVINRSKDPH